MFRWWKRLKKLDKKEEDEYRKQIQEEKLTGKEKFSIYLSAFLVIVLPVAIGLLLFGVLVLALFGAL